VHGDGGEPGASGVIKINTAAGEEIGKITKQGLSDVLEVTPKGLENPTNTIIEGHILEEALVVKDPTGGGYSGKMEMIKTKTGEIRFNRLLGTAVEKHLNNSLPQIDDWAKLKNLDHGELDDLYQPYVQAGHDVNNGDIALSISEEIGPFAMGTKSIFFTYWIEVFGVDGTSLPTFEANFSVVLNHAINGGKKIHFNIQTVRNSVPEILQGKHTSIPPVTNWELYQIISKKKYFENTIFYLNGRALSSQELYHTHKIRSVISHE
jgi:hypothetical protein